MHHEKDRRIDLPVPFLKEGTVLFVSPDPAIRLGTTGCTYLADIVSSLTPEIRRYLFPGEDSVVSAADMYRYVQELAGLDGRTGFLYRFHGNLYFHAASESLDEPMVYEYYSHSQEQERRRSRKEARPGHPNIAFDIPFHDEIRFSVCGDREEGDREEKEEAPDPRVQAILDAWAKIEREFGITIEDMQILLGYKVKLSRLNITTASRLFLTDFNNQEVKMDDLTKALYFYFLRHPEGARLKELHDHEEEILHIYSGITGRDDTRKIRESVGKLLDPFGNGLNVSLSRIKKAFKDVVGDRIARFYYITGRSGEVRKVGIDRDLVIWEN
ncbi:MAG: hypothetical protein IJK90_03305 [Bacteroidales bacterium]|nr:hypothetical protein [Bacteroidales bacterium]